MPILPEHAVDRRPIPDPTALTTQALEREIMHLKELVFVRLDMLEAGLRHTGEEFRRIPNITDRQLAQGQQINVERIAVLNERFESVQSQFTERDKRTDQSQRDSKIAVDAALQAAKEAVSEQQKSSALAIAKSESSTTKQIDQIGSLIQSTVVGINSTIGDLKDRITRIEGTEGGHKEAKADQVTSQSGAVAIIGIAVGALIGLGGLIVSILNHAAN